MCAMQEYPFETTRNVIIVGMNLPVVPLLHNETAESTFKGSSAQWPTTGNRHRRLLALNGQQ